MKAKQRALSAITSRRPATKRRLLSQWARGHNLVSAELPEVEGKLMRIGEKTKFRGQTYLCVEQTSYLNHRDQWVPLWILLSHCAECRSPFTIKVSRSNLKRRDFNRRCQKHKRPGVRVSV